VGLTVRGQEAVVSVQASVRGQRPVGDTIRLKRERGRFRIAERGVTERER
jgi:hypothetical protein